MRGGQRWSAETRKAFFHGPADTMWKSKGHIDRAYQSPANVDSVLDAEDPVGLVRELQEDFRSSLDYAAEEQSKQSLVGWMNLLAEADLGTVSSGTSPPLALDAQLQHASPLVFQTLTFQTLTGDVQRCGEPLSDAVVMTQAASPGIGLPAMVQGGVCSGHLSCHQATAICLKEARHLSDRGKTVCS